MDVEIQRLVLEQARVWEGRGVPGPARVAAAKRAEEGARAMSARMLRVLSVLLPATTLTALEGPLTVKLLKEALGAGDSDHWLEGIGWATREET
jgi:hypothetical protein